MKEERIPTILFLVSILIMIGVVLLLWGHLEVLIELIGISFFAIFIALIVVGVAVVITNLILIPVYMTKKPAVVQEGSYSIEEAVEPGKDETD